VGPDDWQACVKAREGRTRFELASLPAGQYDRIRFQVGLEPRINHSDPAHYPAGHPLNPEVNGLHWGWQGGYVFMALEGRWVEGRSPNRGEDAQPAGPEAGARSGYSFHIANDPRLMTVELPLVL